jgi:DNA-directed RNA polymerase specialized sigma24 family protein
MDNSTIQKHLTVQNLNILETEFYIPFIKSFEGFNHQEIAYILELPVSTVKLRIKLARKVLSNHLNNYVSDNIMQFNS